MSPSSSRSKNKPSKEPTWSGRKTNSGCLFFDLENGDNTFFRNVGLSFSVGNGYIPGDKILLEEYTLKFV
jgi:hypothetical protein